MTFWAYMLHCRGGAYYTGHTNDLDHRVAQHQIGSIPGFTADRLPVKLVWSQEFPSRLEALAAERQIKGWSRAKKMALIRGDWDAVSALAKKKNGPSTSSGRTGEGVVPAPQTVRPELVEGLRLVCHPDTPCCADFAISARIWRERSSMESNDFCVSFLIVGAFDAIARPQPAKPYRTDNLWLTTCFELFLRREDGSYIEVNFSPSSQWAAYEFDSYRSGQSDLAVDFPPGASFAIEQDHVLISAIFNSRDFSKLEAGISAVIEEKDGTKSYWALRHPPGKPDFHHPDCFALTLEAPEAA